jgi:hypothetical protein
VPNHGDKFPKSETILEFYNSLLLAEAVEKLGCWVTPEFDCFYHAMDELL